jgi:hypothetical protein
MSNRESYGNFRSEGISPLLKNPKEVGSIDELASIGIVLSRDNARELITALAEALKDNRNEKINVTGYRKTNQVTVTAYIPASNR